MLDSSYLTNPAVFLVQAVFGLYVLVVILRFLLQLLRADFYNPVSQFVVKLTTPVLRPLRRVIPGVWGLDLSSLLVAWVLTAVELALMAMLLGGDFHPLAPLAWAIAELVALVLNIFLFAIVVQAILSWVSPARYSPASAVLDSLTAPVLRPLRRVIPPISALDFAPMAAAIGLVLLKMLVLPPLDALTRNPF
jgi:YggT family protein